LATALGNVREEQLLAAASLDADADAHTQVKAMMRRMRVAMAATKWDRVLTVDEITELVALLPVSGQGAAS
jgi:hypothetical protein